MKLFLTLIIIDLIISLILTIIDLILKIRYKIFENKMMEEMKKWR